MKFPILFESDVELTDEEFAIHQKLKAGEEIDFGEDDEPAGSMEVVTEESLVESESKE